jgi:acetylornithine deacetylase/succinyl-diaminopimelate desuccinylase-like protein
VSEANLPARVKSLMPEVVSDLKALAAIPSVAFPGFPGEPVMQAAEATADLLRRYGVASARLFDIPGGYPAVYGEIPGPPGAPSVFLYSHYDVQPAPPEQGWQTDPFQPVEKNGRLYGRGAADDKSGVLQHAAVLRLFDGRPPVNVKILIEGEEETDSHLEAFVEANPEFFQTDVFVINDLGNARVGEPMLSIGNRGDAYCTVEVRTLDHGVHSGMFGGAVPDAWMALIRMLATLVDERGNVAVPGLARFTWDGADYPEELYRSSVGLLDGVQYIGEGTLATRLWSSPAITVIGMDATPVDEASNVLQPVAKASLSMRVAAGIDAEQQLASLMDHLRSVAPWGAHVSVERVTAGQPFLARTDGPAVAVARAALAEVFGRPSQLIGSGGSIPLLNTLEHAVPGAEFILWGAQDVEQARIHGADESVDLAELERCIVAQARFFEMYGARAVS